MDRLETRMRGMFSDLKSQLYQAKDNYQKTGSLMPGSSQPYQQQQPSVGGALPPGGPYTHPSSVAWGPQIDVLETERDFVIIAEVPGVKRDDLLVEVHDRNLFLSGEVRQAQVYTATGTQPRVSERRYGKFSRTIVLAKPVDQDSVNAKFEDGVLEVRLPKVAQQASGVRVPIQPAGAATSHQSPPQSGYNQQPSQQQQHQQAYGQQAQPYQQQQEQPYQQQQAQPYQQQQEQPYQQQQQREQQPYQQQQQQPPPASTDSQAAPTGNNPPPYAVGDVKQ